MPTFADGTPLIQVRSLLNDTGLVKNDFAATEDPTANYDERFGWEVGSRIMAGGVEWVCKDATAGAAVWVPAADESAAALAAEAKAEADIAVETANGASEAAGTAEASAAAAVIAAGNAVDAAEAADGKAEEAKTEAEQAKLPPYTAFASRAQFIDAPKPTTLMRASWEQGGKIYSVVRDNGGLIEDEYGLRWSPDGDVTPEHFGATSDGTVGAVDLSALNTAVDFLKLRGGGDLIISGDMQLNDAWVITNATGVQIVGDGNGKLTNNSTFVRDVIRLDNCVRSSVRGLHLNGRKDIKPDQIGGGNRGIKIASGSDVTVEGCLIENCREHGISIGGNDTDDRETHRVSIIGNTIKDCGSPTTSRGCGLWFFWKVYDFVAANNILIDNQGGGIFVDDISTSATPGGSCLRFAITGNTIYTTLTDSVSSLGTHQAIGVAGSRDYTVVGNQCHGYRNGIYLEGSQANEVSGRGSVTGNSVRAYGRPFTTRNAGDVIVSGNRFEAVLGSVNDDPDRPAIEIGNYHDGAENLTRDVRFISNIVVSYKGGLSFISPSVLRGPLDRITIQDNDFTYNGDGTTHDGIYVYSAGDPIVSGNRVRGFRDGISQGSHANTSGICLVSDNYVTDCTRSGIRSVATNIVIKGNFTSRNAAGMSFASGANNASTIICDNVLADDVTTSGTFPGLSVRQNNIPTL